LPEHLRPQPQIDFNKVSEYILETVNIRIPPSAKSYPVKFTFKSFCSWIGLWVPYYAVRTVYGTTVVSGKLCGK